MMSCYNFSLDEIREQLAVLGYHDVPYSKLCEFKRDLDDMTLLADEELDRGSAGIGGAAHPADREVRRHSPRRAITLPVYDADDIYGWREPREPEEEEEETFVSSTMTPSADPASARRAVRLREPADDEVTPRRTVVRKVVRRDESTNTRRVDETSYTEEVSALGDSDDSLATSSWTLGDRRRVPRISRGLPLPLSARSGTSVATSVASAAAVGLIQAGRGHPHTRNIRKTDPVSRYHSYRQQWDSQRAPGERNHRQLRWAVKEAMMIHEVPVRRSSKTLQVNNYVPPTEKKRKNLRWQVRQDMAQFNVPVKSNVERFI